MWVPNSGGFEWVNNVSLNQSPFEVSIRNNYYSVPYSSSVVGFTGGVMLESYLTPTGAFLGNGNGWSASDSRFTPPVPVGAAVVDAGRRFVDINGDGYIDLINGFPGASIGVWLNRGPSLPGQSGSAWDKNSAEALAYSKIFNLPTHPTNPGLSNPAESLTNTKGDSGFSASRILMDVNGDGLEDLMVSYYESVVPSGTGASRKTRVYINNGRGWTKEYDDLSASKVLGNPAWVLPRAFRHVGNSTYGNFFHDVNGDGLPDYVVSREHQTATGVPDKGNCLNFVFLNTGEGWETSPNPEWILPGYLCVTRQTATPYERASRSMLMDVNGDGLPDFVSTYPNRTGVWLNTGAGWAPSTANQDARSNFIAKTPLIGDPRFEVVTINGSVTSYSGFQIPDYKKLATHASPGWLIPSVVSALAEASAYKANFIDLNSDDYPDIVYQSSGSTTVYLNQARPEVIKRIVQSQDTSRGFGIVTEIGYQPMNKPLIDAFTGSLVYAHAAARVVTDSSTGKQKAIEGIGTRPLVYKVATENGVGGFKETHYRYGGKLASTEGHGDLGFAWVETWSDVPNKDSSGKTRTRALAQFSQSYPFSGTVVRTRTYLERTRNGLTTALPSVHADLPTNNQFGSPWQLLSDSSSTYADLPQKNGFSAPWHFVFAENKTDKVYDLESGELAGRTVSTVEYANGTGQVDNATRQVVSTYHRDDQAFVSRTTTDSVYETNVEPTSGPWILGRLSSATATHEAAGHAQSVVKRSAFTYYPVTSASPGMLKDEIVEPDANGNAIAGSVVKTTEYDAVGNATKVTTTAPDRNGYSVQPRSAEEKFTGPRKRYATETSNTLGHTSIKEIDPINSTVTSITDANGFKTGMKYDSYGTLVETTSYKPDGVTPFVRAIKYVRCMTLAALPQVKYATITHASGSLPSATYHDKFGRVVLAESIGFGGRSVIAQTLFDDEARLPAARRPFFKGEKTVLFDISQVPSDTMGLLANDEWSRSFTDEAGRVVRSLGVGSTVGESGGQPTNTADVIVTSTTFEIDKTTVAITSSGHSEVTTSEQVLEGGYWVRRVTDVRGGVDKVIRFYSYPDGVDWKTVTPTGGTIEKHYSPGRRELVSLSDPDSGTSTMEYDGFGQVRRSVNATGDATIQNYDVLGRVTSKTTPAGTYQTVYDTLARPGGGTWVGVAASSSGPLVGGGAGATHSVSSILDSMGRVTSTTETLAYPGSTGTVTESYTSSVVYDDQRWGRVAESTDPGGFVTKPVYHPDYGYSTGTRAVFPDGEKEVVRVDDVDALGRTIRATAGNGAVATNQWDIRTGRLMATSLTDSNNLLIDHQLYTSDNRGNILSRSRAALPARGNRAALPAKSESFIYDDLDRLTSSTLNGAPQQSFTFDDFGNILTKAQVGTYTYGNSAIPGRLTQVARASGGYQHFDYDAAGRVTHDFFTASAGGSMPEAGARERSFTYTSFGQVSRIEARNTLPLRASMWGPIYMAQKWAFTSLDFWFGLGGGRIRQVKHQLHSYDPANGDNLAQSDPYMERTTTTYLSGMDIVREERLFDGLGWGTMNVKKKHYFPGGEYLEKTSAPAGLTTPASPSMMQTSWSVSYFQGDNLGSTNVVLDEDGSETERQSYSPWGERRHGDTWQKEEAGTPYGNLHPARLSSEHKAGYTGHEMLDDVGIIHMNGRLYDPELGRFMAPDPVIQSPGDSQNYCAYSYVLNNPMKLTDPSGAMFQIPGSAGGGQSAMSLLGQSRTGSVIGAMWATGVGQAGGAGAFQAVMSFGASAKPWSWLGAAYTIGMIGGEKLFHQWKGDSKRLSGGWKQARNRIYSKYGIPFPRTPRKNWGRIIATIVIAVVLTWATAGAFGGMTSALQSFWGSVAVGAATGAGVSASMTAIQGGSWGDILKAGVQGAVSGAITAGFARGIGTAFGQSWASSLGSVKYVLKAAAHGVVGGSLSAAQGGSFRDGFIGSAVSSFLGPSLERYLNPNPWIQGIGAAILGGTASVLSGGKFANGALSAAFTHLFNELAHLSLNLGKTPKTDWGVAVLQKFFGAVSSIDEMNYRITQGLRGSDAALGLYINANGEHSSFVTIYLDSSNELTMDLYDPGGGYKPMHGHNSGDLYSNTLSGSSQSVEWSLAKYMQYQSVDGPMEIVPVPMSGVAARALTYPTGAGPCSCSTNVSSLIGSIPGYSRSGGFITPGSLAQDLAGKTSGVYHPLKVQFK